MAFLEGRVAALRPGRGFDTAETVSRFAALRFKLDGFSFCVRYLPLYTTADDCTNGDLTRDEAEGILDAGLALMAVQHVREPGWHPSADLGTTTGNNAANNALIAGLPPGVNLFLDIEGASPETPARDVISYCNNWFKQVAALGYVPGMYVGFHGLLNGNQLFHSLACDHYWKAGPAQKGSRRNVFPQPSTLPEVAIRGYQITQPAIDEEVHGINIDRDDIVADRLGGLPRALTRARARTLHVDDLLLARERSIWCE